MYLMHLNNFYEFRSIEPNSKKHRNIEKIRFGSIRYSRKVLEFHCVHSHFYSNLALKNDYNEVNPWSIDHNKEKNIIFTNYWPPVLIFIKIFKIIKKNLRKIYLPNRLLDFYLVWTKYIFFIKLKFELIINYLFSLLFKY